MHRDTITHDLITSSSAYFGSGTSFYDFNQDGLDDLTFCSNQVGVHVLQNTGNGFEYKTTFSNIEGMLMHPLWIDIENDGDLDFFVSRMGNKPVLMMNDGDFNFTDISDHLPCPAEYPYSTSACWGDYDHDSFPDLYLSNNELAPGNTSWLFHNLGNTYFEEVSGTLQVSNDVRFAFQCMWIDYDRDGDLDLIVVNDRFGGIRLYEQQMDGSFIDVAPQIGFNIESDLMGLTAGDYDHDSDFDFITTNNLGNVLLRNDDGQFSDVASQFDLDAICSSWSCPFIDSDNDTWEDVYIIADETCNGDTNYYYQNDHGVLQSTHQIFFGNHLPGFSCSKGDFNQDGKYDLISSNRDSLTHFQVWENQFEGGHHIQITLEGMVSNQQGIGSILECYISGEMLMRAVTCGDSYLSQDSQHHIIGIGDAVTVDSLIVYWPSGWIDTFYGIPSDTSLIIQEGMSAMPSQSWEVVSICSGDTVMLQANSGQAYLWNTGEVTQNISIDTSGTYHVMVSFFPGLNFEQHFEVIQADFFTPNYSLEHPDCYDGNNGQIIIMDDNESFANVYWNDVPDNNTTHRENLQAGHYVAQITSIDGCSIEMNFEVSEPEPIQFSILNDSICDDEYTSLQYIVNGGSAPYIMNWYDIDPQNVTSGNYQILITDSNGCSLDTTFQIHPFEATSMQYHTDTVCFDSYTQVAIVETPEITSYTFDFNPDSVYAGQYFIEYVDHHSCNYVQEIEVVSYAQMEINTEIISPSVDQQGLITLEITGGVAPYNIIWNDGTTGSTHQVVAGNYSCTITDYAGCTTVNEFIVVNDVDEHDSKIDCFPNPFTHAIYITMMQETRIECFDMMGQKLLDQLHHFGTTIIDTSSWSNGMYMITADGIHILMEKQ